MSDSKKTTPRGECEQMPLFTGDPHRDTAVSPYEIAAELSRLILEAIKNTQAEKKKD